MDDGQRQVELGAVMARPWITTIMLRLRMFLKLTSYLKLSPMS